MKQLIILLMLVLGFTEANAQAINRGTYGTQSNYGSTKMLTCNPAGTLKSFNKDTLVNTDTGYLFVFVAQGSDLSFELTYTTITGTVASDTLLLFGYNNNGTPLTAATVATAVSTAGVAGNVYQLVGNTTYCGSCLGATSTTVPGAAKRYTWQIPNSKGCLFDNYIIRVKNGGTSTASYSGRVQSQY